MAGGLMRKKRIAYVLLAAAVTLGVTLGFARTGLAQEKADKVKAVFLFKFFDYVTWPSTSAPGVAGDGMLCTYGPHAFGGMLEYIAARKGGDVHFRVQPVGAIGQSGKCHILYVGESQYDKISGLQADSGVLTVGDADGFLEAGGIILMKEDMGKVKLEIDLKNAKKSGLKISSRLLGIAEVRK
jgi:hypothetical protein